MKDPAKTTAVDDARKQDCPHNALRKCKEQGYTFLSYICGSCSVVFEAKVHEDPPSNPREPMFDSRPPWGSRSRQA